MSITLDKVKQYISEDVNDIDFYIIIQNPITNFIKGNNMTQKEQNMYNMLMAFSDTMLSIDMKHYNSHLDDYYLCKNYTLNEFVVLTSALFNVIATLDLSNKELEETIKDFFKWVNGKLVMLLEGELNDDKINNLTISQVCGVFYYAPKVYQNDFLIYLHMILLQYIMNMEQGE